MTDDLESEIKEKLKSAEDMKSKVAAGPYAETNTAYLEGWLMSLSWVLNRIRMRDLGR
jgi:hypothetical protein